MHFSTPNEPETANEIHSHGPAEATNALPPRAKRNRRRSKKNDGPDWMEELSPQQALEDLKEHMKDLRPRAGYMDVYHERVLWDYMKYFFVCLLRGEEREPASQLEPLLAKFAEYGVSVRQHLDPQFFSAMGVALHRVLISMAEDPKVTLRQIHACHDVLKCIYDRHQANPAAYSIIRLALIPRLGLTGQGEADYLATLEVFRRDEAEDARERAEQASDGVDEASDATDPYDHDDDGSSNPPTEGAACGDARLAFLLDWLWLHERKEEAFDLLQDAYFGEKNECSLCGLGPTTSYARGLELALDIGRESLARQWLDRVSLLTELKPQRWLLAAGHRAHAHARLGNVDEALAILNKSTVWADDEQLSPWNRLWFHHLAARALEKLGAALAKTNPPVTGELQARASHHHQQAQALTLDFDYRNGNSGVSGMVQYLS